MLEIKNFAVENLTEGCVTDNATPSFSWYFESDGKNVKITGQTIKINGYEKEIKEGQSYIYDGPKLLPMTVYEATLSSSADNNDKATAQVFFETGKLSDEWRGSFITDGDYVFKEKKVSPKVMVFKKTFEKKAKNIKSARIYATAIGMYRMDLNGQKVGDMFLTPGFTSYKTNLQYQTYDITGMVKENNTLIATVAGGWAVGSFVFSRVNRVTADKQSFLCEIHIEYEDGESCVFGTDASWSVALDGPILSADLYDGEEYDAGIDLSMLTFKKASPYSLKFTPKIIADYSSPVREHEIFEPISVSTFKDETIYDFGQNFAGIVHLDIEGTKGQEIVVRHAEILHPDGSLNTDFLRSSL